MSESKTIGAGEIQEAIDRISREVAQSHRETRDLAIVGIANGGISFARRLHAKVSSLLDRPVHLGTLDISFHRDDIGARPIPDVRSPTEIPFDVDSATILLTDDVLFSGRTARAALNELFDQGRPEGVELAILFDRGNRKLPIAPDYLGFAQSTLPEENVLVTLEENEDPGDTIRIQGGPDASRPANLD